MTENVSIPSEEEIATLPRWARVAFSARCARRVLPLFGYHWPEAPAHHQRAITRAVSVAENVGYVAGAAYAGVADATYAVAADATYAVRTAADAARSAGRSAADAVAAAADAATRSAARAAVRAAAAAVRAAAADAADMARAAIRYDFNGLRERANAEKWTDDTPVPPTVFGPMWPFGVPKDWPQEHAEDRLIATIAPPPDAPAEQVADFQIRLYEVLNKLAIANGGAGLKLDSLGRDVSAVAPVGTGV